MKVPNVKIVFDRKKRANKTKNGSIEIEIIYDRKQKFISTGLNVLPSQFNVRNECIKLRNDAVQMNEILQTQKAKVWEVLNDMLKEGIVDLQSIPILLAGKTITITFLEYVEQRIEHRNVSDGTKRTYRTWLAQFEEYGKIRTFSDLTPSAIRAYDEHLHTVYTNEGTIRNQHKFLRLFAQDAVIDSYLTCNPYEKRSFKIARGQKEQVDYLTYKQVRKIEKMKCVGYLEHVKDLFLLQCYSGLSYSDIYNINKHDCVKTDYGYVYTSRRTKTKQKFMFLILDEAMKILRKYKWELPHINNAKYNLWLKVIGQTINEPGLHSHQGRGAFATIALNKGMPLEVLKKILGHSDIRQTQRYATVLDDTVAQQMSNLFK